MLAGGPELWAATDRGVFRSINDAMSFQLVPNALDPPEAFCLLQLPDGTVLSGTSDGVLSSTTSANSWERRGLEGTKVLDLALRGGTWIAATSGGVYVSDDDGGSWRHLPGLNAQSPRSLLIDEQGRLLVGTTGFGLFRTDLP